VGSKIGVLWSVLLAALQHAACYNSSTGVASEWPIYQYQKSLIMRLLMKRLGSMGPSSYAIGLSACSSAPIEYSPCSVRNRCPRRPNRVGRRPEFQSPFSLLLHPCPADFQGSQWSSKTSQVELPASLAFHNPCQRILSMLSYAHPLP